MTTSRRRTLKVSIAIATVLVGISACSSSGTTAQGGTTSSTTPTSETGSPAGGGIQAARSLLAGYSGEPTFVSPGPSFDASKVAGKSMLGLPVSSSVNYVQVVDDDMAAAAKKLGIKYIDYPNQQIQSQWIQGVQQAVSQKADVLALITGIPPEQLAPQLTQAKNAGVHVVDVAERDDGQPTAPYVSSYVYAPFTLGGRLMAAWAANQSNGKAHILLVTSDFDVSSSAIQKGVQDELHATCPGCSTKTLNVNPSDWATKLQTTVEAAIQADPGIDYILPVFDPMATFIAPAITASGRTGKIQLATWGGTPAILDLLRTGNVIGMDVADNTSDVALAALDATMRLMLGLPAGKQQIRVRVMTKDNVEQAGVPAKSGEGFGNSSIDGYAKTWNMSPSQLRS